MVRKHELEVIITKKGEVKVHIKGIKGKKCLDIVEIFKKEVGNIENQTLTSEYYEPEPSVGIKVRK